MIVPARELMPVIRAALERGQRVRMTVTGSSMLPFVRDGDVAELEPPRASLALGDIVLAKSSAEHYVLHRAVRIRKDVFFLRGDAQEHGEEPVTRRDVLGQVTSVYRHGHARALNRGAWRLAGLIWTRCKPLGLWLFLLAGCIRRSGGKVKHRLTNWGFVPSSLTPPRSSMRSISRL